MARLACCCYVASLVDSLEEDIQEEEHHFPLQYKDEKHQLICIHIKQIKIKTLIQRQTKSLVNLTKSSKLCRVKA